MTIEGTQVNSQHNLLYHLENLFHLSGGERPPLMLRNPKHCGTSARAPNPAEPVSRTGGPGLAHPDSTAQLAAVKHPNNDASPPQRPAPRLGVPHAPRPPAAGSLMHPAPLLGVPHAPRPPSLQEVPTLRQLWARGQQVIVSYEEASVVSRHAELWPRIPYWWGDQVKAQELIRYLERMKSCGRPGEPCAATRQTLPCPVTRAATHRVASAFRRGV